jgi:hypothetical protein
MAVKRPASDISGYRFEEAISGAKFRWIVSEAEFRQAWEVVRPEFGGKR